MSIIAGPFPWLLLAAAVVFAVVALRRWPRAWFRREVPVAAVAAIAVATAVSFALHHVGGLIADPADDYPRWLDVLAAGAILFLGIAVLCATRRRWRTGTITLAAALVLALLAGDRAAIRYGYPPDVRALLGGEVRGARRFDGTIAPPPTVPTSTPPGRGPDSPTTALAPDYRARHDGELLSQVPIVSTVSGFAARSAYIYLPPAYFAVPRPPLPVMVLLAGVPGQPKNWLDGLGTQNVFAAYAGQHDGRAPILVFADYTGGFTDDRGCTDSPQGRVETYLTVDVPAFVRGTFGVAAGPASWGIGGFSDGGTCALMIGLRHPDVYGPIVAFSPDASPTFDGGHDQYVARFLAGDASAFAAHDPLSLLRSAHVAPTTAIYLEAGDREPKKEAETVTMAHEAQAAGIPTDLVTKAGRHNFDFWRQCVTDAAPWIGGHLEGTA